MKISTSTHKMKTVLYQFFILLIINCLKCDDSATNNATEPPQKPWVLEYSEKEEKKFVISYSTLLSSCVVVFIGIIILACCIRDSLTKLQMYEEYRKDVMKIREEMEDHYNMEMKNQIWDYERDKEKKKDMDEMRRREADEEEKKKNPPSTKQKSVALKEPSKKKKEVPKVPEKKKKIPKKEEEFKFTNRGPIIFTTQTVASWDIINTLEEKEEKKISIKKVKWDENPIGYHETGVGVDQVEIPTPSSRGGSSSIMTASIRQVKKL
ncbi:hypothetical protein GCK72_008688 [Caenorhabditis remanei]|uniref:Uncharacterized protein n=1 Tax=Caenorhabditis remanei TaxID=31234 RepID=A0A6A5H0C4_CAERE|nr:hypothetical protein GCK72_008688 [Caenorhabditis remanei]KAF1760439.1 hypothetical protein GCK72_008688 [Caenorhabditis remanei]